jgi:hypothetical protein
MAHVGRNMLDFYYSYIVGRGVWQQQCILRGFYLYELHFCLLVLSDLFTPECRVVKEKYNLSLNPRNFMEF